MLRKALVLIYLSFNLLAFDLSNITFIDFIRFVSNTTGKNFVIDETIDKKFSLVIPANFDEKDSLKILESILYKNNMYMVKRGSVYYIKKYDDYLDFYSYKLNFVLPEKVLPIVQKYFPKVHLSKNKKTIIYRCNQKQSFQIQKLIKLLDKPNKSKYIRITLLSYRESDLKDFGNSFTISGDHSSFTNIVNNLTTGGTFILNFDHFSLSSFFSYLNTKGLVNYRFNPVLNLSDDRATNFYLTKKIPFLNGTNEINGANEVQNNTYSYKDVGSVIKIDKVSITDDDLYFHLNLRYEIILEKTETPVTAKREIDNYIKLKNGSSILIAGLKSNYIKKEHKKIPLLGDIPYLGSFLFSWTSDSVEDETFAILISNEVIDPKKFTSVFEDDVTDLEDEVYQDDEDNSSVVIIQSEP